MQQPKLHALVLIADDNHLNLEVLSDALLSEGLDVAVANDGETVLQLVCSDKPDLILLDALMPGLSGFETCRRLKADPATRDIPIMFTTSLTETRYRLEGFDAGAVDYVTKPFERAELMARVRTQISLRRATRALQEQNARLAEEIRERAAAEQALAESVRKLERRTEELREANERMTQLAHRAGMAEIATNILHNVGNLLNSVNVSSTRLEEQITTSRVPMVRRLAKLLEEQGDLATFFKNDPRGQRLPSFVRAMGDEISQERERNLEEIRRVRKHIASIGDIIALQQMFAGAPRFVEQVDVPTLLEDALSMSGISSEQYTVVRDYAPLPGPCRLEKHRVLQIFVNLITNADDALRRAPKGVERTLTLRVRSEGEDRVCIDVADNGGGIAPEALTRLFTFGFTTRPEGHGFGLHSCAVNAKAMGGEIRAQSEGVDKGATFTLILPRDGVRTE